MDSARNDQCLQRRIKELFSYQTGKSGRDDRLSGGRIEPHSDVLEAVLRLPAKYKDVVYLHYYEGYTAPEIAQILNKKVNTVYTLLSRAKRRASKRAGR